MTKEEAGNRAIRMGRAILHDERKLRMAAVSGVSYGAKTTGAELRPNIRALPYREQLAALEREHLACLLRRDRGLNGPTEAICQASGPCKHTLLADSAQRNRKEGAENALHRGSDRIEPQPTAALPLTEDTK